MRIWVDSTVLSMNRAKGRRDPPIIVERNGRREYFNHVTIAPGIEMVYEHGCTECGVVHLRVDEGMYEIQATP